MPIEMNQPPSTRSGAARHAVVASLVRAMVQALQADDRAIFARLFDVAFRLTHGVAWEFASDAAVAERQTAEVLLHAFRAELEAIARNDADSAQRS
jgi:hypothetical protein